MSGARSHRAGPFVRAARAAAAQWKASSPMLPPEARPPGAYRQWPSLPFCLPPECAGYNLLPEARVVGRSRFEAAGTPWHDGHDGPSNHLLSSQVQCVNALAPFVDRPDALAAMFGTVLPIAQVLPAFHAFASDTVLVAHNAAFDLRFLQLKEAATGLRFDQPVLDTLLLSAVVHPNQESHQLETIAERFGLTVVGRHTALGDAMVTAEVFLKLVPLLAERGIHTLGQAREAAQKTYYARIKY